MTEHPASADPEPADPEPFAPEPGEAEPADLEPADPEEVGVEPETPEAMQVEASRLLANDARADLREQGFDDRQIDRWANTYVAEHGSGDLDTFLAWVARQERSA